MVAGGLGLSGCDSEDPTDAGGIADAGLVDGAVSTDAAGLDAGPIDAGHTPVCRASTTPGCQETCEFFYDCAVNSSIQDLIEALFPGFGFSGPEWMDCTGCVERCEAGSGNEAALACFTRIAGTTFCDEGAADPTVAASSINECCEGQLDSTFCQENCRAASTLMDYFPVCEPFAAATAPPTCGGTCPAVSSAIAIEPTGADAWSVSDIAFTPDGAFAVTGHYAGGAIDFGAGALPSVGAEGAQYVAVFDAAGGARWSRALSEGVTFDPVFVQFMSTLEVDAAGNVTVLAPLRGTLELGGSRVSAGLTDVLLASFSSDGSLRWAHRFGDAAEDLPGELALDGTDVVFTTAFEGQIDLGGGPLTSAGDADVGVARYASDGSHVWSRRLGGAGRENTVGLTAHPSGEYTLVGAFFDTTDLGEGPVTSAGMGDTCVGRYRADGSVRWLHTRGGTAGDFAYQVAADGEAAVVQDYIGDGGAVPVGPVTTSQTSWIMLGQAADGATPWALLRSLDTPGYFIAGDMDIDATGDIVLGLAVYESLDLGTGPVPSVGGADAAVARLGRDGTPRWIFRYGSGLDDVRPFVEHLASGELAVGGVFVGALDYGGASELSAAGRAMYVLRLAAE